MEAKSVYIFAILIHVLSSAHKASADNWRDLFGAWEYSGAVLYMTIAIFVLLIFALTCVVANSCLALQVIRKRKKRRQKEIALDEKNQWHGGAYDIIDEARKIAPMPRAMSTSRRNQRDYEKGYDNHDVVRVEEKHKTEDSSEEEEGQRKPKKKHQKGEPREESQATEQPKRGRRFGTQIPPYTGN